MSVDAPSFWDACVAHGWVSFKSTTILSRTESCRKGALGSLQSPSSDGSCFGLESVLGVLRGIPRGAGQSLRQGET